MARSRKQRSAEHAESLARKIWLAGLGAYGKSVEDAQGQLDKASQEASKMFHELVAKGTEIENQSRSAIRSRISEARDRLSERASSNVRPVEEMIQRVRERVSRDGDALAEMVSRLTGRRSTADAAGTRQARGTGAAGKPARKTSRKTTRKTARKPGAAKRSTPRR